MDKHWANLMLDDDRPKRYGDTIQSKAHNDPIRSSVGDTERADREAGHAFCDRYRVNIPVLR